MHQANHHRWEILVVCTWGQFHGKIKFQFVGQSCLSPSIPFSLFPFPLTSDSLWVVIIFVISSLLSPLSSFCIILPLYLMEQAVPASDSQDTIDKITATDTELVKTKIQIDDAKIDFLEKKQMYEEALAKAKQHELKLNEVRSKATRTIC